MPALTPWENPDDYPTPATYPHSEEDMSRKTLREIVGDVANESDELQLAA